MIILHRYRSILRRLFGVGDMSLLNWGALVMFIVVRGAHHTRRINFE